MKRRHACSVGRNCCHEGSRRRQAFTSTALRPRWKCEFGQKLVGRQRGEAREDPRSSTTARGARRGHCRTHGESGQPSAQPPAEASASVRLHSRTRLGIAGPRGPAGALQKQPRTKSTTLAPSAPYPSPRPSPGPRRAARACRARGATIGLPGVWPTGPGPLTCGATGGAADKGRGPGVIVGPSCTSLPRSLRVPRSCGGGVVSRGRVGCGRGDPACSPGSIGAKQRARPRPPGARARNQRHADLVTTKRAPLALEAPP